MEQPRSKKQKRKEPQGTKNKEGGLSSVDEIDDDDHLLASVLRFP